MTQENWFQRSERFVRDYAGGVGTRDLQRMFDRDAVQAFEIVTREHESREPSGRLKRFFYRAKILFLGLSFKLTPPRRVLFAISVLLSVLALQGIDAAGAGRSQFVVFHVAAIAGLIFLIVLELADRIVVRDELEVAKELQRDLLPPHPPTVEGWTFAFSYSTANTIGGDYYDFIPVTDGRLALVIGDASGHGIAAGLLMAIASSALKLALDIDPSPASVARFVNRALYRSGGPRAFMTMFCGLLDPADGRLDYVVAGHPFPLLRRASGELEELGEGGLPLGVRAELESPTGSTVIEPGDQLLLYTDGIVETLGGAGDDYGYERVRRAFGIGGSALAIHDRIVGDVIAFQGEARVLDDRSLVVVTRSPKLPPLPDGD